MKKMQIKLALEGVSYALGKPSSRSIEGILHPFGRLCHYSLGCLSPRQWRWMSFFHRRSRKPSTKICPICMVRSLSRPEWEPCLLRVWGVTTCTVTIENRQLSNFQFVVPFGSRNLSPILKQIL